MSESLCYEDLCEMLADIQNKKHQDPGLVLQILSRMEDAHISLSVVSQSKAEKILRELQGMFLGMFTHRKREVEAVKLVSKRLLKKFADLRRAQLIGDTGKKKQGEEKKNEVYQEKMAQIRLEEIKEEEGKQQELPSITEAPTTPKRSVYHTTGWQYRDQMQAKFVEILKSFASEVAMDSNEGLDRIRQIGVDVETELHDQFGSGKDYNDKARSLIFNLKDPKNPSFRRKLLRGEICPRELLKMSPSMMSSELKRKERQEQLYRGLLMNRSDYEKEMTVQGWTERDKGFFKCEKCGSFKTGFQQFQIERADEPMTNFIFCYDCEHRYKC